MEKVYLYKDSSGVYRVYPPVVVVKGGNKVRFSNGAGATLFVTVPAGASHARGPVKIAIPSEDHDDITTRSQGEGRNRSYNYTVKTSAGIRAKGNSDPVLIIDN